MVEVADILRFVDAVAERFEPERIILFGSYAYGAPTPDSDVDILVIPKKGQRIVDQAVIRAAAPRVFPMDLLVRREPEIRRRIRWNDFFLTDIMEKGLVLHDAHDHRVGAQGRRRLRRRLGAVAVA
jgi:predicted nucleotidyltransferase